MSRTSRRSLLRRVLPLLLVMGVGAYATTAISAPNGTRPSVLSGVSVVATSSTQMRVTGSLRGINGAAIAGARVDILGAGVASFSTLGVAYTNSSGNFSAVVPKPPVGFKVQIDAIPNGGAWSRPFPTFNRP